MDDERLVTAVLEREGAVPTAALPERGDESARLTTLPGGPDELRRLGGALARLARDGAYAEVRERAAS